MGCTVEVSDVVSLVAIVPELTLVVGELLSAGLCLRPCFPQYNPIMKAAAAAPIIFSVSPIIAVNYLLVLLLLLKSKRHLEC